MRRRGNEFYSVLFLGDKDITDDLSDSFTFSCTNKRSLSKYTGIAYHRLVYLFTKLGKMFLIENGNMIIRSKTHFKGKQPGGIRNPRLSGYNRER